MGRMLDALRRIGDCPVPSTQYPVLSAQPKPPLSAPAPDRKPARSAARPHRKAKSARTAAGAMESLRAVCGEVVSRLLHEFPPGRNAALLFCPAGPDDSMAIALAALGAALASHEAGKVLVVDGGLGDEALARHLGVKPGSEARFSPKRSDRPSGKGPRHKAVRHTRMEHLDVLPALKSARQMRPLSAARWAAALRRFCRRYRFVLIGVSSANVPQTCALARPADATYLVVHPGRTGKRAARQAVRTLRQSGARVLGCVLVEGSPPRGAK